MVVIFHAHAICGFLLPDNLTTPFHACCGGGSQLSVVTACHAGKIRFFITYKNCGSQFWLDGRLEIAARLAAIQHNTINEGATAFEIGPLKLRIAIVPGWPSFILFNGLSHLTRERLVYCFHIAHPYLQHPRRSLHLRCLIAFSGHGLGL